MSSGQGGGRAGEVNGEGPISESFVGRCKAAFLFPEVGRSWMVLSQGFAMTMPKPQKHRSGC